MNIVSPPPPEAVFDAWTSPAALTRWWAAQPTGSSPGCAVDLRVGGRYTLRTRNHDGDEPTTVTLHHTDLASAQACDAHRAGWRNMLENLGRRMFEDE